MAELPPIMTLTVTFEGEEIFSATLVQIGEGDHLLGVSARGILGAFRTEGFLTDVKEAIRDMFSEPEIRTDPPFDADPPPSINDIPF